jgi:hypothetical protein
MNEKYFDYIEKLSICETPEDYSRILESIFTQMRRNIAGDGPSYRALGALEAFDKAYEEVVAGPFINP